MRTLKMTFPLTPSAFAPLAMAVAFTATHAAAGAASAFAQSAQTSQTAQSARDTARPPNVVLILTDDQGWGDAGFNGNPRIHTPTLDRLASEGVVMNHFYVSPLSAPTRASLLTGRYHLRTGVSSVQGGLENMRPTETSLAKLFRANGYATGCFGKWHNGAYYPLSPNGQGFDEFLGFCCGHWANYFDPALQHNERMVTRKGYITDILTDAALDFIGKNKNTPFFCYIPYNAPHAPFQVPDKFFNRYKNIDAANDDDRAALASIYAMVECIDENIARVLKKLDDLGLAENTIVVFMSDNGPTQPDRFNGDMRGRKGQVHEGGVRVPCLIRWPGKIPARIIDEPAAHIDIWPTLRELCALRGDSAYPLDGISLAARLLGGKRATPERAIYTHRRDGKDMAPHLGAARTERERLCIYPNGRVMLFDIAADPSEKNNIYDAENPRHRALRRDYMRWYDEAAKGVESSHTIPVGHAAAPQTRIGAPEGRMSGALKVIGFPNQNWVRHFQTENDTLDFTLSVVADGDYEISLDYACAEENPSARFTAIFGDENKEEKGRASARERKKLTAPIPVFLTQRLPSPDRVPRKEAYPHTWGRLSLGRVHLKKGDVPLTIFATGIRDPQSVWLMTVIVEKTTGK